MRTIYYCVALFLLGKAIKGLTCAIYFLNAFRKPNCYGALSARLRISLVRLGAGPPATLKKKSLSSGCPLFVAIAPQKPGFTDLFTNDALQSHTYMYESPFSHVYPAFQSLVNDIK